jgi:hypothetical protein
MLYFTKAVTEAISNLLAYGSKRRTISTSSENVNNENSKHQKLVTKHSNRENSKVKFSLNTVRSLYNYPKYGNKCRSEIP